MVRVIIIFIFIGFSLISCSKKKESNCFKVDEHTLLEKHQNNIQCNKLFSVNSDEQEIESQNSMFMKMIEDVNKGDNPNYSRLILMEIKAFGEIITTTRISIRILKDKLTLITTHKKGENILKSTDSLKSFSPELFFNKIKQSEEKVKGTKISALIVDFKNEDSFNCKLFQELNREKVIKIKNYSFFDKVTLNE